MGRERRLLRKVIDMLETLVYLTGLRMISTDILSGTKYARLQIRACCLVVWL